MNPPANAPLWRRLAALFYDLLVLVALWMAAGLVLLAFQGEVDVARQPPLYHAVLQLALLVPTALYFAVSWSRGGQTIGMRAWRVRLVDAQGHSPFVWSVIGGISQTTDSLRLGTGVTCPTIRIHPAIIAQAAATSAAMMPGRFFLGVGTGEALNEHVTGQRWPSADERRAMLEEAIDVMRTLWEGGFQSYKGRYYQIEDVGMEPKPAQKPYPPIIIGATSQPALERAGRVASGWVAGPGAWSKPASLADSPAFIAALGYQEALRRPGTSPFMVALRSMLRPRPNLR